MSLSQAQNLTVAFVLHNEAPNLNELLASLEKVEGLGDVGGILFVDNASTDSTLKILSDFQEHSPFPVKLLSRKFNHMGRARMEALTNASTRWVLFCDGDCRPNPGWLSCYLKVLENLGPQLGTLYAGVGGPARPLPPEAGGSMARLLSVFRWTHLQSPQGALKEVGWDADHLPCSNALLDRKVVLEHGGFSDSIARVGEDLELGLRLVDRGYRWRVVPALEIHHKRDFNLEQWIPKMLGYGRAQVSVSRIRGMLHARAAAALVAGALVMVWILLVFAAPRAALGLVLVYILGVFLQVMLCPELPLRSRLYGMVLIPATHIFYALGALLEVVAPRKSLG